jgi:hypothetical protein
MPHAPLHTSTCVPSSTTEPGGRRKKLEERFAAEEKSALRGIVGKDVAGDAAQLARHIGFIHEAKAQGDAPQAQREAIHIEAIAGGDVRRFVDAHI